MNKWYNWCYCSNVKEETRTQAKRKEAAVESTTINKQESIVAIRQNNGSHAAGVNKMSIAPAQRLVL